MSLDDQSVESRIAEYQVADNCYRHYDSFTWQVGAVLIAGTFVFWGCLMMNNKLDVKALGIACLFINLLLSIWILYAQHNREIYIKTLAREWELEKSLKMHHHRRFKHRTGTKSKDKTLTGHHFDYLIYAIASLGGPAIGYFKIGFNLLLFSPVPVIFVVLLWISWRNNSLAHSPKAKGGKKKKEEK